ncbi:MULTISPECIES: hypothetical protein [Pseudanabaena]|uniref:hypothetical protein n=1 Tax=Pseudanabaena TaxID=1152 RepID=UPI0024794317|nr:MULTISPECIES: hypothetical protein [Pseudanabaena]MEA5489297.1 hypothetical protein [Pseudanabaena sp. CCNP1317]WGS74095.1 hypothetical protein OA858_08720 [Pseudanabaena galeata CCNP1313]
MNKSSVDVDQLAGRLGGNCYFFYVGSDSITQAFVFSKELIAQQFLNAVQFFPEFLSGKLDSI